MTSELRDILSGIDFRGNPDSRSIQNITYDSRKVKDGTLFVALKGQQTDGHDYIRDAVDKGASAVISNGRSIFGIDVPVIQVENPRAIMSKVAANFYEHPSNSMTVVGVTGTNGKTSITHLLKSILSFDNIPCGSLGTLGFSTPSGMMSTGFTTPESVEVQQLLRTLKLGGIQHAIMEISSHALSLHRVDDVDVDIAIFTNLTQDHLDFHQNIENYFQAKLKLFTQLGNGKTAILNLDNPYTSRIIKNTTAKILTFGFDKSAMIHPISYKLTMDGIQATLKYKSELIEINSKLIGIHNLSNIMASVASAIELDIPTSSIVSGIEDCEIIPGRMENVDINIPGKVFVDYAHTPDAYEKILTMIKDLSSAETKVLTLFGCGGSRDHSKRPLMAKIAEQFSEHVFVTSDNPRNEDIATICDEISKGFENTNHTIIHNRFEAINKAMTQMDNNTILLILGKGREDYEQIGDEKVFHSDIQTAENFSQ
ncbi:MAG: UDP-N-acetylmuramoyl-L-alanyl-D-glutamate--2,6-diaminopimelate ligase [Candidatus Marinimicrobia bacterium]|nr:UDP-N-acetylmuramoyl-L-alanyl-D-glutamate--2,6-diaminopimelate ligase [Candidatus Neomarinimicrobiota bacterium]MBL7023279.1 UDP-N-acetylmuramoyl-L-alanyl-D-glutamate--2,6-diaminopimelate ligase [Candidatus Neomarinimicrobiota bacterium]MBL7108873.1 UDP-N-acetylmuramoyl-L-alanyl-D-glutamate--2,6-diaminopimelate ligase [Candidatus Neomarinimicrobiota bacterium]